MVVIWLVVIAILLVAFVIQTRLTIRRNRQLAYIYGKLERIVDNDSEEKPMLLTDDPQIKRLLLSLSRLLEHNRQRSSDYARTEISIKKMLSNMSHDLRTPLTVVLGLTETLGSDDGTLSLDERKRLQTKVHQKAQEILSLMNQFFDLARLEAGDRELPLSKINISEVCKNNVLFFYESIAAKGIEVSIEIPEAPIYALANEEALDRILSNLISNAIRYGSEGKVIGISLRTDEFRAWIEVWDRGKGISEAHQQSVFERLYTLEDSRNQQYQGSGLGLTITKRLVELLGGSISLESKPGERTAFRVELKRMG